MNLQGRSSLIVLGAILAIVVVAGIWLITRSAGSEPVQIKHLHGLSFSNDGKQLIVPAHDGLVVYENGQWRVPNVPANDYMGYSASNDGFYSSGHPDRNVSRVNPFGLVKSNDGGKTLTALAFEGESDFHVMAVGYKSHAIYLWNPNANSTLSAGLHYSLDDAQTWTPSNAEGLAGDPIQLAAHPTEANIVAAATEVGLFASTDHGQTFQRIGDVAPITAVAFSITDSKLIFGYRDLQTYDLAQQNLDELATPPLAVDDGISNIAPNPLSNAMAVATFGKNVFLSGGNNQPWTQIAWQGNSRK